MKNREALTAELRALRTRRGLTLDRLEASPALMALLGGTAKQAYDRLVSVLHGLGSDLHVQALKAAYGIGSKHGGTLTDRRGAFAEHEADGRHSDTIELWENKVIDELVTVLLSASEAPSRETSLFTGWLTVAATYDKQQLRVIIRIYHDNHATTQEVETFFDRQLASPPFFFYQVPPLWTLTGLVVNVTFRQDQPAHGAWLAGDTVQALMTGELSAPVTAKAGELTAKWDKPTAGGWYGFWWQWSEQPSL